jgi:regulator of nucleoside diphosphate kinase
MNARTILITEDDLTRLERLVASARRFQPLNHDHLVRLQDELERATVVANSEIPGDVVTMNSEVRVKDLDTGRVATYKIVFPRDAHVAENRISVLAPLGTALLGYRAGDVIEWDMPVGKKRLKVQAVVYQPEAARLAG